MTYCAIRPGPYDAGAYITASNNLHTLIRVTTRAVGQSGEAMIYKTEDLSVVHVSPSGAQVYRPKDGVLPVAIKHAHLVWLERFSYFLLFAEGHKLSIVQPRASAILRRVSTRGTFLPLSIS